MQRKERKGKILNCFLLVVIALLCVHSNLSWATQTLGQIATNLTSSFGDLAKLITGASYLAGIGFALAAILKFKAHKDNPTQIPIGTPIALIFVAAALMFLPTVYTSSGKTVFSSGTTGGLTGVSSFGS